MDYNQKVLWSEGLFLTPHHFQQSDRYHEHQLKLSMQGMTQFNWGVSELKIDTDALNNGELMVVSASGVMPDGTVFAVPDLDAPPPVRPIESFFDPEHDRCGVYLVAPLVRHGVSTCSSDGVSDGRPTRYRRRVAQIGDENAGMNRRQVDVQVKNLRIAFEREPLEDSTYLKIGDMGRAATGSFMLVEEFVPPVLRMSASMTLLTTLRRIIEIISSRAFDLSKQRRQRSQGLMEFTMSEAANFWFLHTLNTSIPILLHHFNQPHVHPERVYIEVAGLIGKMFTFSSEGSARDVPPYDHERVGETFARVEDQLSRLLKTIIPTRCVPIPLERLKDTTQLARIPDERLLDGAQFYLAVSSSQPADRVVREIPLKTKISSHEVVQRLIAMAIRGLTLKYLPAPPSEIPVQPGRHYFQLEKDGEHWEAIRNSRSAAFFIPPEFTDLRLELMAVKE